MSLGENCTSGCKTKDHATYGECLRGKHIASMGLESTNPSFSTDAVKAWDKELDRYEDAVKQGIQPASTRTAQIDAAMEISQRTGTAFNAEAPVVPDA